MEEKIQISSLQVQFSENSTSTIESLEQLIHLQSCELLRYIKNTYFIPPPVVKNTDEFPVSQAFLYFPLLFIYNQKIEMKNTLCDTRMKEFELLKENCGNLVEKNDKLNDIWKRKVVSSCELMKKKIMVNDPLKMEGVKRIRVLLEVLKRCYIENKNLHKKFSVINEEFESLSNDNENLKENIKTHKIDYNSDSVKIKDMLYMLRKNVKKTIFEVVNSKSELVEINRNVCSLRYDLSKLSIKSYEESCDEFRQFLEKDMEISRLENDFLNGISKLFNVCLDRDSKKTCISCYQNLMNYFKKKEYQLLEKTKNVLCEIKKVNCCLEDEKKEVVRLEHLVNVTKRKIDEVRKENEQKLKKQKRNLKRIKEDEVKRQKKIYLNKFIKKSILISKLEKVKRENKQAFNELKSFLIKKGDKDDTLSISNQKLLCNLSRKKDIILREKEEYQIFSDKIELKKKKLLLFVSNEKQKKICQVNEILKELEEKEKSLKDSEKILVELQRENEKLDDIKKNLLNKKEEKLKEYSFIEKEVIDKSEKIERDLLNEIEKKKEECSKKEIIYLKLKKQMEQINEQILNDNSSTLIIEKIKIKLEEEKKENCSIREKNEILMKNICRVSKERKELIEIQNKKKEYEILMKIKINKLQNQSLVRQKNIKDLYLSLSKLRDKIQTLELDFQKQELEENWNNKRQMYNTIIK